MTETLLRFWDGKITTEFETLQCDEAFPIIQELVGENLEGIPITDDITLFNNAESDLLKMKPTMALTAGDSNKPWIILGPGFFATLDEKTGTVTGLTEDQINRIHTMMKSEAFNCDSRMIPQLKLE